jgi:hypothetical protein
MTVHSCYCIGIFVLSGLFQIQKRIQNLLENSFGKLENKKEKEKGFSLLSWLLAHRPSRLLRSSPPPLALARLAFLYSAA